MSNKNQVDVLNGDIPSSFRKLAIPLSFSFVLYQLNSLVDKIYVSRIGEAELGAMGVSDQFRLLVFTIGIGFAIGTGVVVARRVGEGKTDEANHVATQAMITMFLYALVIAAAFYFTIPDLLHLFGYYGDIFDNALEYLYGITWGIPFNFLLFQTNAIVRSTGDPRFPMKIITTTILINALLSPLLIFDFILDEGMGIYGAGLATAISQILGFGLSMFLVFRGRTPINISLNHFKFDLKLIVRIFYRGIPSTLQYLSLSGNRLGMFAIANTFGAASVTAYTIGISFDLFVFMPIFGWAVAMEVIAGQNRGANQIDRIFEYFWSGMKQISFLVIPMIFAAIFFGDYFAHFFSDDPEVVELTSKYLQITSLSYLFFAVGVFSTRVISGAGDTWLSFIIYSSVLFIIQMPGTYLLSEFWDMQFESLYWGVFISYTMFLVIGYGFLKSKIWLRVKL